MFAWLKELDGKERKTLIAAVGGWATDSVDVMVFVYVVPTLMVVWSMSKVEAGWITTATVISSAVGGWLACVLADRYGRVRMLQVSILWFAFFTFLCGFTNSFEQLLITRSLQGLGFGGEWAVGSVLIGEMIRPQHRGKAVGTMQSGWAVGWGVAGVYFFRWIWMNAAVMNRLRIPVVDIGRVLAGPLLLAGICCGVTAGIDWLLHTYQATWPVLWTLLLTTAGAGVVIAIVVQALPSLVLGPHLLSLLNLLVTRRPGIGRIPGLRRMVAVAAKTAI